MARLQLDPNGAAIWRRPDNKNVSQKTFAPSGQCHILSRHFMKFFPDD
ncbi:MAG: hypothetical protein ACI8R4_004349 [Paracoccaceae bacterium]|jgi:hypothetical protein